ncbi:acetyl-CoA carboxylase [Thioclava sp.]|uniref:acetyl-CoA carboxylase n=1 Tax=Thioclava sp. TaxID=1933450 RepID=UPI003AA88B57
MADIQSPVPGTFYHRPSPEDAVFKSEGDSVAVGDTIGLVEVMKSFIEVQAEEAGTFAGYSAEDEAAVSAGDVLATLK